MSAMSHVTAAAALLLAFTAGPPVFAGSERAEVAAKASAGAASAPGATTSPPTVAGGRVAGTTAGRSGQRAEAAGPSLVDVVKRIERILQDHAQAGEQPAQHTTAAAKPRSPKPGAGTGGQSARPATPPGRPAPPGVTLKWADPDARPGSGLHLKWPSDLDPHTPVRPLGVRLSWPSSDDIR